MEPESTIRALIVDDEAAARRGVRLLLDRDPEVEVVGECTDGKEAVAAIRDLQPDLLFLDIQMPELDGFEMLRCVGDDRVPVVIFITAYDAHALRAFDVHAVDYLLKPYTNERFNEALVRAKAALAQPRLEDFKRRLTRLLAEAGLRRGVGLADEATAAAPGRSTMVTVRRGNRSIVVNLRDVEWIGAEGDYAALHVGDRRYLHRETMNRMEALLPSEDFVRIHRSTIVRVDFIAELRPHASGRYEAVFKDGTVRRISSAGRRQLDAAFHASF